MCRFPAIDVVPSRKMEAFRGRLHFPAELIARSREGPLDFGGAVTESDRSCSPMGAVFNLSAYKFVPLAGLPALKGTLLDAAMALRLKGTVLLSPEGINLFVAGDRADVTAFVAVLHSMRGLEDLTPKESESMTQPFGRMRVKIKKEIIAFGVAGIDPAARPAPKLAPETLKKWLDEGRPLVLLDTRNDYEIERGTFRGARRAGIRRFRDFPAAVQRLSPALKDQPIVMYCTGGIRCEKAGPLMQREGFRQVFQLDGGILKYFERCGGTHFDGECFVFDERVGLDAELRETAASAAAAQPGAPSSDAPV